jgi:FkbM family methyltransferase
MHPVFAKLIHRLINKNPRFKEFLARCVYGSGQTDIVLFGVALVVDKQKESGYLRASRAQSGISVLRDEIPLLFALCNLVARADTFVDVGANVGLHAAVVAKFDEVSDLNIYCFEPHPQTFGRLEKNVSGPRRHLFNLALSDTARRIEFFEGASSGIFGVSAPDGYQIKERVLEVQASTLDSIEIAGNAIVIKIDAEHHEFEVIRGARGLLGSGRVIAVLIDGYDNREIETELAAHGFDLFDGRTFRPANQKVHVLLAIKPGVFLKHAKPPVPKC